MSMRKELKKASFETVRDIGVVKNLYRDVRELKWIQVESSVQGSRLQCNEELVNSEKLWC